MIIRNQLLRVVLATLPIWLITLSARQAIAFLGMTILIYFLTRFVVVGLILTRKERFLQLGLLAWLIFIVGFAVEFFDVSPFVGVSVWLLLKPRLYDLISQKPNKRRKKLEVYLGSIRGDISLILMYAGMLLSMTAIRYFYDGQFNFVMSNHPTLYFLLLFLVMWCMQAFDVQARVPVKKKKGAKK